MQLTSQQEIQILHVDDEPSFRDLTETYLEREDDQFTVETAPSADEGLQRISDRPPDCVVSDYNMPGTDGLEFLQAVREGYPDLPFILFTGKGSESVASDAIAADVTDYLQKGSGSETYDLLANRIRNAVKTRREAQRADRQEDLMRLTELAGNTGGFELNPETGKFILTDGACQILNVPEQAKYDFEDGLQDFHPDDREDIQQTIEQALSTGEQTHSTWRHQRPDEEQKLIEVTYTPTTDGETTIIRGSVHDITDREERQRDLKQIETLFQHAQDSLFLIDVGTEFTIERVNPAWEAATGLSAERVRGQTPRDILGEQPGAAAEAKYRECIQREEPLQYEETARFDGEITHWATQIAPVVVDGAGEYIAGSTRDVTEQKERQQELRRSERRLNALLEHSLARINVTDAEGRYTFVSPSVEPLFGHDPTELVGESAFEYIHPDDRAEARATFEQVLSDPEGIYSVEYRYRDDEGSWRWVESRVTNRLDDPAIEGIVTNSREITDRKQREQELARIHDLIANMEQLADAGAWEYDSETETLTLTDGTRRLYGLNPNEDLTLEAALDAVHPDDRDLLADRLETCLETGEPYEMDVRFTTPDGRQRWLTANGARVSESDAGSVVRGYIRDITEQQTYERELEAVKSQYQTLIERYPDGAIFLYDSDLRVVRAGGSELSEAGFSLEEIEGSTPQDRYPPEIAEELVGNIENALAGESHTFEQEYRGEHYRIQTVPVRTGDEEITHAMAVSQNITDQVADRQELERRNDLFGKAQDIADIGAWAHDTESGTLTWTDQVYEMHGVSKEFEPSVDDLLQFYHPEDRPKLREAVDQATTEGESYDLEVRMTATDDGNRWFRTVADPQIEGGDVVRVRGIVHDITDRVEREQELRQYEHFFKNSPDQIALLDEDLTVQYQSPPSSLHELEAIEVEGENPLKYVHPDDRQTLSNAFEEVLTSPGGSFSEEFRAKDVSGEWRWVETRAINLLNEDPADGILVMIRDITQQKRQRLKAERQNDRLDEFASIVSHDLRSPLSIVEGRLELAQETCESDHLAEAADALNRSQALIDDLLKLAREGETVGELEPIGLADVAERSWQTVETGSATLETHATHTLRADRSRLQELVENLYRNAVEHCGEDVTVSVGAMDDGFYVADTGPGIPEADREEVFEVGYSTSDEGTGFGLRIVEQIADAHGWESTVTESEQGGARFEFTGVEFADR